MSNQKAPLVLVANVVIRGKITCLTGLHIGGNQEKLEIGGLDSPVVRDPVSNYPYIPGSSIKGKLRHLLEYITGALNKPFQGELGNVSMDEDIVRLFGIGAEVKELAHNEKDLNEAKSKAKTDEQKAYLKRVPDLKNVGLTRLIVRDALPDEETTKLWKEYLSDENYTEVKSENFVDRLTSAANPRFLERVTAGSKFEVEFVYSVLRSFDETDQDAIAKAEKDLDLFRLALRLLENNFIGKSGSRGYGKIRFDLAQPVWLKKEDYLADANESYRASVAALEDDKLTTLPKLSFAYAKS